MVPFGLPHRTGEGPTEEHSLSTFRRTLSLASRGVGNYFRKVPLCVSFEITYRCNARCKHCHLGGPVKETPASPERYGEICRELNPLFAQVSGGEPLLRPDVEQVIRALAVPGRAPYIVVTTNGFLLKKEKFRSLTAAGVDTWSVSFDYPDERHDEFRRLPGLFSRIERLVSELEPPERTKITLNCVVQRDNFRELVKIAELARRWGVGINFSTYTWLRNDNKDYLLTREEIPELRRVVAELLDFGRIHGNVLPSEYAFKRMVRFFEEGGIDNCQAGSRFMVVNPDGTMSPCGLVITKYNTREELLKGFCRNNACTACNVSSRANSEKSAGVYLLESPTTLRRNRHGVAGAS